MLVHELIVERLREDLALFTAAARAAHEAAIHEENIPDNKYDTLSLEASYVAQGQANRAQEIRISLHAYQTLELAEFDDASPVRVTALVGIEAEDGECRRLFVGPRDGGMRVTLEDEEIMIITPSSPLGLQLIDSRVGDAVTIGKKEFEIVSII